MRDDKSSARGSGAMGLILLLLLAVCLGLAAYVAYNRLLTPVFTRITPNPAPPGSTVTLRGERFAGEPGGNIVLFGATTGRVLRVTPTELEVQVPDLPLAAWGEVRVPVRVLASDHVSAALELVVAGAPETAQASPPPALPPTPPPPPAQPSPGPTPVETPAPPPSTRPPAPPPVPSPPAPDLAGLLGEAEKATQAHSYEAAVSLYEEALRRDPENAKARAGRAAALSLSRTFVSGKTLTEGREVTRGDFKDFDTREVSMKKPPEVPARLDFEARPSRLKAGDPFEVKVYLQNDGAKSIKIASLSVITTVNDTRAPATSPRPHQEEVGPRQRALLHELSGVWKDGVTSWSLEVLVTSSRGDAYRSLVSWK